jgi:hypothetical protein
LPAKGDPDGASFLLPVQTDVVIAAKVFVGSVLPGSCSKEKEAPMLHLYLPVFRLMM